jgi:hypothetical protein
MKTSKILNYIIRNRFIAFFGVCFSLHLLVSLPFLLLPDDLTQNPHSEVGNNLEKVNYFFMSIVLGPLFETFIFQFSVIKVIRLFIKKAKWGLYISVPFSALLFSLNHSYSIAYMVATFLTGLVYAVAFYIAQYRRDFPAFIIVAIIHSSWNIFAFSMNEIL